MEVYRLYLENGEGNYEGIVGIENLRDLSFFRILVFVRDLRFRRWNLMGDFKNKGELEG